MGDCFAVMDGSVVESLVVDDLEPDGLLAGGLVENGTRVIYYRMQHTRDTTCDAAFEVLKGCLSLRSFPSSVQYRCLARYTTP